MAYIYEYLNYCYKDIMNKKDLIFIDLGSGTGKAVISMSLMHYFKKIIGIEYLENIFNLSQEYKNNYINIIKEKQDLYNNINNIEFIKGDFLKYNWENADIIFANSTCFSSDVINNIALKANKECKSGTIIITFTKNLNKLNSDWELRDGFRRLMTWGVATIYIHKKK